MALRIVTANIKAKLAIALVLADVRRMTQRRGRGRRPDVLNFQEIGGKRRAVAMRTYLATRGYAWVQFHGRNRESVPIAFRRRRFQLVASGSCHLSGETRVGRAGAGPATLREKWATWVLLEDRDTGELLLVVNCHLAPSITIPERGELHATQVAALAQLSTMHAEISRAFCGDFNTESRDRLAELLDTGLSMGKDVTTHGRKSAIDRVITDLDGTRQAIPGRFFTDHTPLEADLDWPAPNPKEHR